MTTAHPDSEALSPADEAEFRARCRAFLDRRATGADLGGRDDPRGELRLRAAQRFQKALAEAGLAGLTYPAEYGGAGLTKAHERVWRDEYARYPNMTYELTISHGMCLPMLAEYGTEAQKAAWMARNISGEEVWCQMFSEPAAGSDVAGLRTRAVRDGDQWVIDGEKVWTTLAHLCAYGIVIARTDMDAPKHAGISMFAVAMDAPGIEIRPIHQIDGGTAFNQIFFTGVRIIAAASSAREACAPSSFCASRSIGRRSAALRCSARPAADPQPIASSEKTLVKLSPSRRTSAARSGRHGRPSSDAT